MRSGVTRRSTSTPRARGRIAGSIRRSITRVSRYSSVIIPSSSSSGRRSGGTPSASSIAIRMKSGTRPVTANTRSWTTLSVMPPSASHALASGRASPVTSRGMAGFPANWSSGTGARPAINTRVAGATVRSASSSNHSSLCLRTCWATSNPSRTTSGGLPPVRAARSDPNERTADSHDFGSAFGAVNPSSWTAACSARTVSTDTASSGARSARSKSSHRTNRPASRASWANLATRADFPTPPMPDMTIGPPPARSHSRRNVSSVSRPRNVGPTSRSSRSVTRRRPSSRLTAAGVGRSGTTEANQRTAWSQCDRSAEATVARSNGGPARMRSIARWPACGAGCGGAAPRAAQRVERAGRVEQFHPLVRLQHPACGLLVRRDDPTLQPVACGLIELRRREPPQHGRL